MLDTTAIASDPLCAGTAWRVLANVPESWGVTFLVPEVVVSEAIASFRRRVAEASNQLEGWGKKHGAVGVDGVHAAAEAELSGAADAYPETLRRTLDDLGALVVPPPAVEHMVMVNRATERRKPCNASGDGYRDTLNWLTLLSEVSKHPDDEFAWISDNSKDFGNDAEGQAQQLHPQLVAELAELGAEGRVTWYRNLPELVLGLAGKHAPDLPDDLRALRDRFRDQAVTDFVKREVLGASTGSDIDASHCALSTATISASLVGTDEVFQVDLQARGTAGKGQSVAEFTLVAESDIAYTVPAANVPEDAQATMDDGLGTATVYVTKPLRFAGLVTLDRFGRPQGVELASISAPPEDPGHSAWSAKRALARRLGANQRGVWMSDPDWARVISRVANPAGSDSFRRIAEEASRAPMESLRRMAEQASRAPMENLWRMAEQASRIPMENFWRLAEEASRMGSGRRWWIPEQSDHTADEAAAAPADAGSDVSDAGSATPPVGGNSGETGDGATTGDDHSDADGKSGG